MVVRSTQPTLLMVSENVILPSTNLKEWEEKKTCRRTIRWSKGGSNDY